MADLRYRVGAIPDPEVPPIESLIDPASAPGVQPVGQPSGWSLTFSDEFSDERLNTWKWLPWYPDNEFWNKTEPGGHLSNTNEPEAYDPSALSFSGSIMTMTMRNESIVSGLPYTSGMVCSAPRFAQTYGWFEARMRLPGDRQSWPAFWLYPLDSGWPPEIDIMENFSSVDTISCGYIAPGEPNDHTDVSVSDVTEWHTYACRWEAGRIRWYVDGSVVKDYQNANVAAKEMQVHCNLAGLSWSWPAASDLPFSTDVDWIRAWEAT